MSNNLIDKNTTTKLKSELSHLAHTYTSNYRPSPQDLKKHRILKELRKNKNIVILRPDKGNGVVILDRSIYNQSISNILSDTTKFKKLSSDPTLHREAKLQRFLRKLKKQGFFENNDSYFNVYPKGSHPARIYGLPKLHKVRNPGSPPPFRPIVSSIGTYNYNLAKFLCGLLNDIIPNEHTAIDSFSFVNDFQSSNHDNKFFVSFDVVSLFTNIPLIETINLAVDLIFKNYPNLKISKSDLIKLFSFATCQTHFLFNGLVYDQVDGVAMGSPLAPVLANLFMGFHEDHWLKNYHKPDSVLFYRRYVDDIFCIFNNETDATDFFNYLNLQHPNIKFTLEKEINNCLSFLDVKINKLTDNCVISVHRKKTYTGLLTNFQSFTSFSYKIGLIRTLIDRAFKINNTKDGFNKDVSYVKSILQRNSFPSYLIDKVTTDYLNKSSGSNNHANNNADLTTKFFKLPFIGKYSSFVQKKIRFLSKRLCQNLDIKLVFSSFKLSCLFSVKDTIPLGLRSRVVYKFTCAGCNTRYIGETIRHFSTRINEHLCSDKSSHIYKHIVSSPDCKNVASPDCFVILDSAVSDYQLKIKEALFIESCKPELNTQVKHYNTTINL